MRYYFIVISLLLIILGIIATVLNPAWAWSFLFIVPFVAVGLFDSTQKGNNIWRNYPWVGHIKALFVENREIAQDWLLENDLEGRPFNWVKRNIIYKRADNAPQEAPFGTQYDYKQLGFEWFLHSAAPIKMEDGDLRITVGGPDCKKPYSSSILNISGMSFGSISKTATMALNGGAKLGNFASNTGEGGLTEYHLHYGGDLIFQFGTGYFGCRDENGSLDENSFRDIAQHDTVKMIEMKISQGAKPGYGAVLPGPKVTPEIAAIRRLKPYITVVSPAAHTTYSTPVELMYFIKKLRDLSGGKPTGFKLCMGQPYEFLAMCKAMVKTGIMPDFITIDGGEGGTGAAPFDSINWVGMPAEDALIYAYDALVGFDLKKHIKLFVSGKIVSGFQVVRYLALGADACNIARGMMFAIGCVQALQCNENTCPSGVTTMKPQLYNGIVPDEKRFRVKNYHDNTVNSVKEMLGSAGLKNLNALTRKHIARRVSSNQVKTLDEVYPYVEPGALLKQEIPARWAKDMAMADPDNFHPNEWDYVERAEGNLKLETGNLKLEI
jgi:glutamate synthase domain-containing protein 2